MSISDDPKARCRERLDRLINENGFSTYSNEWYPKGCMDIGDYDARRKERLSRFIAENRVESMSNSYENILTLLKQGGVPVVAIEDHLKQYWSANIDKEEIHSAYAQGAPFDHIEVWGRGGTPLLLIGHPFQISNQAKNTLNAICLLGMDVVVSRETWYKNPLTFQIKVYHAGDTES